MCLDRRGLCMCSRLLLHTHTHTCALARSLARTHAPARANTHTHMVGICVRVGARASPRFRHTRTLCAGMVFSCFTSTMHAHATSHSVSRSRLLCSLFRSLALVPSRPLSLSRTRWRARVLASAGGAMRATYLCRPASSKLGQPRPGERQTCSGSPGLCR
jgi:hypothetical protein